MPRGNRLRFGGGGSKRPRAFQRELSTSPPERPYKPVLTAFDVADEVELAKLVRAGEVTASDALRIRGQIRNLRARGKL